MISTSTTELSESRGTFLFIFLYFVLDNKGFKVASILAKFIALWNLENAYNYIVRTNFNRDSPKTNNNIYIFSYNFWDGHLKLSSYDPILLARSPVFR